jgi:signal transduction histidine kinase
MSLDPQLIRSEPHTEIGTILQRSVEMVIERWSRRAVEEQPNAKRVHHEVLLDHLQDFLSTLGRSLVESEDPDTCQHCLPASMHGEQRWEAGWSLPEVVRDYQILRLVILDFLEENLDRPLGYREVLAIGLALDEAIAASVVMYVNSRDQYFRQSEEKRAEEDKRVQRRLQEQAEAFQEADRRKNEFLAMLAHELLNPLAPIRNAVQIQRLKSPPDSELHWTREVIERQIQQMTRMVDDLLDISRITLGKVKLQKETFELATVVARAVEMVRPLVGARKQRLTVALLPEPVWLEADPARLAQVLTNLLTNAVKFTDEGGQIWLAVDREESQVVIKVRDTGMGISPDLLPRVFDPFTQEDRSAARSQGGLGIGLALVRSLVDMHEGRVQAFSAGKGQGSEFVVHLPAPKVTPPPLGTVASEPRSRGKVAGRRILVVDDNADGAQSLGMLLQMFGHEVRTAQDGPAAIEEARKYEPEVVLLDIGLPGMDGLEVARRLRQELGLKALLVAMTGYGQEEYRRRSQEAGFNAHLVKPVDLETLHTMLAQPE